MRRRMFFLLALGAVCRPYPAMALFGIGDIVNDPLNLVQNTFTAARMYQNNLNQVIQVQNDLKHLIALPTSMVDDVMSTMREYSGTIEEGAGYLRDLQSAAGQFDRLYQAGFGGNATLMQRGTLLIGAVRDAGRTAARAQAIYKRLSGQEQSLRNLMAASKAAPGELSATQATNQLLVVLGEQQASMQQLQATSGQLQLAYIMRQMSAEEQAQINAHTYLLMPEVGHWQDKAKPGPRLPQ